jgi:hypothetical protein
MIGPFFWSYDVRGHGVIDTEPIPTNCHISATRSTVLAAATEVDGAHLPFQGMASIQVLNIACIGPAVKVRLNVLWDTDLDIIVRLAIWPET